ncbi:MAG: branched-chain amino acid ABC transporter ATP-binding protein/permease [Actinomycetota bacterium]
MRKKLETQALIGGARIGPVLLLGILLAVILTFPTLGSYSLYVFALLAIQGIAVLSLNLLMGYAGQVSLGQAAFIGMGAYGTAQFASWGVPFPFTIVFSVVTTVAAATLVGLPSLRIKGLQLAATTLAFGIMAEQLLFARPWSKTATVGMIADRPEAMASDRAFLVVALLGLGLVLLIDSSVRRSRIGRSFFAVRYREDTAAARGVPVGQVKLLAYAMAGLYAGIAGGLFAYLIERVSATPFSVWKSLWFVVVIVVGGIGSWSGALVAAILFTGMTELLRPIAAYSPLIGAVLLMLAPVLRPQGLGWILERPIRSRRARVIEAEVIEREPVDVHELVTHRRPVRFSVPMRTLLSLRDVELTIGGLEILRGVNLEIRRGELVGLIGPNGAGKTTVFNCVSGFLKPTAGEITYRGRDVLALPPHARPDLGIIRTFQQVGICAPLTVWDNVLLGQYAIHPYGVVSALVRTPRVRRDEKDAAKRATAALEAVGLRDLAGERAGSLPHATQRLVEVAGALAAGPEILLLDEPAAGMDPEETRLLGARLAALRKDLDLTMVVIEHHIPMVADLCEFVYVLAEGRVMAEGSPAEVQRDPAVIATYLGEERLSREEVAVGV